MGMAESVSQVESGGRSDIVAREIFKIKCAAAASTKLEVFGPLSLGLALVFERDLTNE